MGSRVRDDDVMGSDGRRGCAHFDVVVVFRNVEDAAVFVHARPVAGDGPCQPLGETGGVDLELVVEAHGTGHVEREVERLHERRWEPQPAGGVRFGAQVGSPRLLGGVDEAGQPGGVGVDPMVRRELVEQRDGGLVGLGVGSSCRLPQLFDGRGVEQVVLGRDLARRAAGRAAADAVGF